MFWNLLLSFISPTKKFKEFYTPSKERIDFRFLEADDVELLVAFYHRLSPATRYMRFQFPTESLPEEKIREYAEQFAHTDPQREVALLALHREELVGVIRYVKDKAEDDNAEFAIVLRDDFQKKRLGLHLMNLLIIAARKAGLRYLYGNSVSTNQGMIRLVKRAAAHSHEIRHEGGSMYLQLNL